MPQADEGFLRTNHVWDKKQKKYAFLNEQVTKILGYTHDQIRGMKSGLADVLHPDDTDIVARSRAELEESAEGKVVECEYRVKDVHGNWRWINFRSLVFSRDENGHPVQNLGIALDITEHKNAESEIQQLNEELRKRVVERSSKLEETSGRLRESEGRFRAMFEQASVGLVVVDWDGRIVESNSAFQEIVGYSKEELAEKTFGAITHPDDLPANMKLFEEMKNGTLDSYQFEKRYKAKNGSTVWAKIAVFTIGTTQTDRNVVAMVEDVTERQKTQGILRRTESLLRTVIDNAPLILFSLDRDGVVTLSEGRGLESLGLKPGQLVGKSVFEAYRDVPKVLQENRRALAGETLSSVIELQDVAFETVYTPLRGSSGEVDSVIGVAVEVTDLVKAGSDLKETNDRLGETVTQLRETQHQVVQQERLRALGTMASGIAHDFNNSLVPILGVTEIMLEHPSIWSDNEKMTQFVTVMNTAAKDASAVVRRLREFYRHRETSDPMQAVDVNTVLNDVVTVTEPKWKGMAQANAVTIMCTLDLSDDQPRVFGDAASLRSAMTNLVLNAVDAMPDGGELTLRSSTKDGKTKLSVSDTGVGMSREIVRKVQEPFFTTKGEKGSGLGLAMVHGIVERHDGRIHIDSTPGKGTTMTIELPIVESAPAGDAGNDSPQNKSLRVLAVDDDRLVRFMISEYLVRNEHAVEMATSGTEALAMFDRESFDLVITDRSMPGLNGDQLAAAVKKLNPDMPVIMLTGFGDMMEAAEERRPEGVDILLDKPITPTALRDAIAKVI